MKFHELSHRNTDTGAGEFSLGVRSGPSSSIDPRDPVMAWKYFLARFSRATLLCPRSARQQRGAVLQVKIGSGFTSGFTVVELLIATLLSAMLVVSVMGLLGTMKAQCDQWVQRAHAQPWEVLFAEQLRRDLANTRYMVADQNRMVLSGYVGTRGDDLFSTLRAAEVTYKIVVVDDVSCLLRDEHSLISSSNSVGSRQLVATSIGRLRLVRSESSDSDETYSGPVPESCRLLFFDSLSGAVEAEVLWCQ